MKTVFSGIQASGELHVGNYVGAIHDRVTLQDQYRALYAKEMPKRVSDMALDILALGVDPEKTILLTAGAEKARALARRTTGEVRKALGSWR